MSQSRLGSFIESLANALLGACIGLVSQIVVFPAAGVHGVRLSQNLVILGSFTAISVARSYVVRRVTEWLSRVDAWRRLVAWWKRQ